ncbi:unnamed protein product [Oppiella nova]|uniref:Protein kinase domain-containing protein n=1 Tax=Oppiella nova TaxID=334625 RepID=A0A7R9QME7_9ACAR|nr:unnamed protein product [Oppiella nova]CAG2168184.1 unnamed protein product [Oppiella nova]
MAVNEMDGCDGLSSNGNQNNLHECGNENTMTDTQDMDNIEMISEPMTRNNSNNSANSTEQQPPTDESVQRSLSINYEDQGFYEQTFDQISFQGKGGFGSVYKVRDKTTDEIYAIKLIPFKDFDEEDTIKTLREMQNLVKVKSQYVVDWYQSWREAGLLFIQMEFCSQNLMDILKDKPQVFSRKSGDLMNLVEYFISCEILRQILESVQYLHELNPQIIHRDFKPDNILIADIIRNGRFIKLCDFGLATVHENSIHNKTKYKHTTDTRDYRYMAPENLQGKKYNHKTDFYSVALIGGELFDIVVHTIDDNRPECRKVMDRYSEWSIDKNILINDKIYKVILNKLEAYDS